MRVMVTGGSGRLGRRVAHELSEHGYDVVNASRRPPDAEGADKPHGVPYRAVDLRDIAGGRAALEGCAAVVHLGAIPHPWGHPDADIFAHNTQATYAVLQAAAECGVRRVVLASSYTVYGGAFGRDAVRPRPLYVPVDEEHPVRPGDPYSLSKVADEQTGAMFQRRDGLSVLALRFLGLLFPGVLREMRAGIDEDPARGIRDLWGGYVDVRDAARACRLGLEADGIGYEVCNIGAADTLSVTPTEDLLRRYAPEIPLRLPLPGTASGWSSTKAGRLLGYAPRYGWQE